MRRTDPLSKAERSRLMSKIRGKHTKPEMFVRRLVRSLGHGYRLHRRDLPGCPDLVFAVSKKVILVHGCFWHYHKNCPDGRIPKSRRHFWAPKLNGNAKRDSENISKLSKLGWRQLTIWECELEDAGLKKKIKKFLGRPGRTAKSVIEPAVIRKICKARSDGMSFNDIEKEFRLRRANGMTAYRIVAKHGGKPRKK